MELINKSVPKCVKSHSTRTAKIVNVCMLSHFSHVQLFVTPWAVVFKVPLSMGYSRQECWSGLPCPPPEDLPDLCLLQLLHCRQILYHWATGEVQCLDTSLNEETTSILWKPPWPFDIPASYFVLLNKLPAHPFLGQPQASSFHSPCLSSTQTWSI